MITKTSLKHPTTIANLDAAMRYAARNSKFMLLTGVGWGRAGNIIVRHTRNSKRAFEFRTLGQGDITDTVLSALRESVTR